MLKLLASLAAEGQDGNGLQLEKLRLHTRLQKTDLMAVVCLLFAN